MQHYFSICAIMRNESRYLVEWVDFHAKLGCTKFFLYDNSSSDDTLTVLAPYVRSGLVEITPWSKTPGQITAYEDATKKRLKKRDATWVAFIDLDEFIIPQEPEFSLLSFLKQNEHNGAVAVHWLLFGTSGHDARPKGGVLGNYIWRINANSPVNRHYKSIVNFGGVKCARPITGHAFNLIGGVTVNTAGKQYGPSSAAMFTIQWLPMALLSILYTALSPNLVKPGKAVDVQHDCLRVHHYFVKSREDWEARLSRGDVNNGTYLYLEDMRRLFTYYDKQEVEDRTAADFK